MTFAPDGSAPLTAAQVLAMAFPRAGREAVSELPLWVIPQGDEPRWIVLGDTRAAAPVLRSWRPFKVGTRLRWAAVVHAAALGLLARLPGVVAARAAVPLGYWRRSLPQFRDDWIAVVHIGNRSHTRKIIVFFAASDGSFQAVAKVPLASGAPQAILHEAAILGELQSRPFLPKVLFEDPQRGIAAQSWLEGAPVSRRLTPAHMELLAGFVLPGAAIRVCDQAASVAHALDECDFPFDRGVLSRALGMLDCRHDLPAFLEHRDFAPWNLKRLADGQTGAVDWEWAALRGLPCQDIFRYFYIQDALFHGRGTVWQTLTAHPLALAHYRRFHIPSRALPALAAHYLLRVLAMDWRAGNTALARHSFRQITSLVDL